MHAAPAPAAACAFAAPSAALSSAALPSTPGGGLIQAHPGQALAGMVQLLQLVQVRRRAVHAGPALHAVPGAVRRAALAVQAAAVAAGRPEAAAGGRGQGRRLLLLQLLLLVQGVQQQLLLHPGGVRGIPAVPRGGAQGSQVRGVEAGARRGGVKAGAHCKARSTHKRGGSSARRA